MSDKQQIKYIENYSKKLRRELWMNYYDNVDSSFEKADREFIDNYVSSQAMERYDQPLEGDEVSRIYKCYFKQNCVVFHISLTSSYHSGWGEEGIFVLLNIEEGNSESIRHQLYAE